MNNVKLEDLEKKLKGLQHISGATDQDLYDAHAEAEKLAAAAEEEAKKAAESDTKAAEQTVADRIAARKKAK